MGLNLGKRSHCDDKINYSRSNAEGAIRCLKDLQALEDTPNFGVLTYNSSNNLKNNRYDDPVYDGKIDSTFYTDMATATLAYTMKAFHDSFGDRFSSDVVKYIDDYFTEGSHDLENDFYTLEDAGRYDMSLFDANLDIADSLYAYYNEYQLVDDNSFEIKEIEAYTYLDSDVPKIVLKKREDSLNMNFYYVGENFYDFSTKLLQHDYNVNFLEERIPIDVLNASENGKIITVTEKIVDEMNVPCGERFAGYAHNQGSIIIRDDYFTDAICHELGHQFDYFADYEYHNDSEIWGELSDKYAKDICSIRKGADIGAGYSTNQMKEMVYEFYAEAFQLYFYSPETRAALPKEVREAIEQELEMYT